MHKCLLAVVFLLFTSTLAFSADYTDPVTGMEFMAIPGGVFIMGDNQYKLSTPEHEVTIQPFLMGRHEVTFDQYAKFCSDTERQLPSDEGWGKEDRPVINVTWRDAAAFAEWLSEKTGKNFRLPSEAEWEFAARGGTKTTYPWGDLFVMNRANCDGCGSNWDKQSTAPVGSFKPNGYGLYDMIGNVYEWCMDMYQVYSYQGAPTDGSAWSDFPEEERLQSIQRSASWRQPVDEMKVTQRCYVSADEGNYEGGFRLALDL